ncbi:MAG: DNA-binding protein, partial [Gammaproteobacteria bacterium]|nr:DNA-binding protein [Gammaproteobacteria bacterium]
MQTGTVAEAVSAGGYVYIKLEEQNTWLAASAFEVSVGDKVQYGDAMEMNNFHSKALDRTFDSILFVSQAGPVTAAGNTGQAQGMAGHGGELKPYPKSASALSPAAGEIAPLQAGKTIAAVFEQSAALKGKTVSLRAKVIKVNQKIMGKNWITLQDGTGSEPGQKLLATSQEIVAPGAVVIATGVIKTDVDLGYGYE